MMRRLRKTSPAFRPTGQIADNPIGNSGRRRRLERLLVVTPHFWPEPFRINDVVDVLVAEGVAVTVLTGQPNYPEGRLYPGYRASAWGVSRSARGVETVRVPVLVRGKGGPLRLTLSYASYLASACCIGPMLLRGHRFDAILFYGLSPLFPAIAGLWLGLLKKAPFAIWVQDLWPGSLTAAGYRVGPLTSRVVERLAALIYRSADAVLVSSEGFVAEVKRMAGARVSPIYHPNPAELAMADRPCCLPGAGDAAPFEVVFAGNLGRAVGLSTIIQAASRIRGERSIRFRIVGSGSRSEWLRNEVRRLDLDNVVIHGRIAPEEMRHVYERASALLISLSRSEAMALSLPSKTATCLATGRPVIVSADGETAKVVTEAGAGYCVPAGDPAALADAVVRLRDLAPHERAAMGAAGRAYAQANFEPRHLARRLIGHLERLVDASSDHALGAGR